MDINTLKRNISLYKLGLSYLEGDELRVYNSLYNIISTGYYDGRDKIVFLRQKGVDYDSDSNSLNIRWGVVFRITRGVDITYGDVKRLIAWWIGLFLDVKITHIQNI